MQNWKKALMKIKAL